MSGTLLPAVGQTSNFVQSEFLGYFIRTIGCLKKNNWGRVSNLSQRQISHIIFSKSWHQQLSLHYYIYNYNNNFVFVVENLCRNLLSFILYEDFCISFSLFYFSFVIENSKPWTIFLDRMNTNICIVSWHGTFLLRN